MTAIPSGGARDIQVSIPDEIELARFRTRKLCMNEAMQIAAGERPAEWRLRQPLVEYPLALRNGMAGFPRESRRNPAPEGSHRNARQTCRRNQCRRIALRGRFSQIRIAIAC